MDELLAGSRSETQFIAFLMGAFALLALTLAAVGIYGVVSYTVSQLTHQVGIRVALGARGSHILKLIMGRAMGLLVAGLALGLLSSLAATRVLSSLLYEVSPLDGSVYMVIPVFLAAIAGLASYMPARRAVQLDPVVALWLRTRF
jgi:ABC-type antimicrobial peptide transport system permease subunit